MVGIGGVVSSHAAEAACAGRRVLAVLIFTPNIASDQLDNSYSRVLPAKRDQNKRQAMP